MDWSQQSLITLSDGVPCEKESRARRRWVHRIRGLGASVYCSVSNPPKGGVPDWFVDKKAKDLSECV